MRVGQKYVLGLAALTAGSALLSDASPARANGRMPGSNDVAFHAGTPGYLLARATYGLVQSFDHGASFQWVCEQAIDTSGVIADPPVVVTENGSIVLLPPTGSALVSSDRGCSWTRIGAPLEGQRGVDLTLDPQDAARVLALTSTIEAISEDGFGILRNLIVESRDDGQTWSALAVLPSDFEAETIEVAPSDPSRIYVSGTASDNPRLGVIERSDDGGLSWTRSTLELPAGTGSMFVSAIHPQNPDALWVRVPARGDTLGILPARLYVSFDKAQSFTQIAATKLGMFGFALSPDGSELVYGGPGDGLYRGPADGSGAFEKIGSFGVRCLRWPSEDVLYACGTEPSDAFSVAVSRDKGATFEPLYRMVETCPQVCPEGTAFALSCEEAWTLTRPFIQATGSMCAVPWAAPPEPEDAGAPPAPQPDSGSMEEPKMAPRDAGSETAPAGRRSSGCSTQRSEHRPWWLVGLGAWLAVWQARVRGRRRTR